MIVAIYDLSQRGNAGEREHQELRHARFLFTDQIALLVARGFDLLDDEWVRDVIITQVSDRGAVEKEVRDMDDV